MRRRLRDAPESIPRGLNRYLLKFIPTSAAKRSLGYAHRFRPTYAIANVGHPSCSLLACCHATVGAEYSHSMLLGRTLGIFLAVFPLVAAEAVPFVKSLFPICLKLSPTESMRHG
jgi:hypothetical protein